MRTEVPFTPHDIAVRPAGMGDTHAVARLFDLARIDAPPPTEEDGDVHLCLSEHGRIWLAEHRGEPLGFISLREIDSHRMSFRWLWVDARQRRRGVGRRLLQHSVVHCEKHGYLKIELEITMGRDVVMDIVRELGFQFGREKHREGRSVLEFYLDLYREPSV